jgi:hypothetical protein
MPESVARFTGIRILSTIKPNYASLSEICGIFVTRGEF